MGIKIKKKTMENDDGAYVPEDEPKPINVSQSVDKVEQERQYFKNRRGFFKWAFGVKGKDITEAKQPLLWLIRTNHDIDVFEGVPDGLFRIKQKKKDKDRPEEEMKGIILSNSKLLNMRYGDKNIKMWIAFENEAVSYPTDVTHDSSLMVRIYEKIMINLRSLDDRRGGVPDWVMTTLKVVVVVAIIAYLLYTFGAFDWIQGMIQQGAVQESAKQIVQDQLANPVKLE